MRGRGNIEMTGGGRGRQTRNKHWDDGQGTRVSWENLKSNLNLNP